MNNVDKKYVRGEYSKHLRNFINKTLEEEKLNSYELSRKIGCSDTVLRSFLDGKTSTLNSKAVVALADYKKVFLDEVVGREVKGSLQEIKLLTEEAPNLLKKDEQKIPAFLSKLTNEAQQSLMQIKEHAQKFKHNINIPNKELNKQNKKPLKPKGRSF
ncbi:hypothetical protein [Rickettsia endosymbiont of Halotydeus destructor]|uniref:hypothetical protein n=1 Tax=Rickettsia endosymbiont of Halotydeus destructor TaxID=2996754 RepID=UPI003BAF6CCC